MPVGGEGGKEEISREVTIFVKISSGSTDVIMVWETFKVYVRGEFLSQGELWRKLEEQAARLDMVSCISELEQQHKVAGTPTML